MGSTARFDFNTQYEFVGVSQTDAVLGNVGKTGNLLERIVVTVSTAATSTVSIKDGSGSAVPIVAANTPIGVYSVNIGARSVAGSWKITTGAGASVMAIGEFRD